MTSRPARMAAAKLLRRAAAAAAAVVLLGTFQGPSDPSNLVGFSGMNFSYILAVEAGNSRGSDGQKERSGLGKGNGKGSKGGNEPERRNSDPMLQMNGDDDHAEKEGSSAKKRPAKRGGVKGQSNLRGSASNASGDKSLTSENPVLESIFSAFTEFGKVRCMEEVYPLIAAHSLKALFVETKRRSAKAIELFFPRRS